MSILRVAIVDDLLVYRKVLRLVIRAQWGLTIVGEAGDGRSAIKMADRCRPDVVLMDAGLPGMDGFRATEIITAAHPDTIVIVLSLHVDGETHRRAREAGALGAWPKDFTPASLVALIRASWAGALSDAPERVSRQAA
jgi:DNA-binding NarL/FixJ family response regulator